MLRGVIIGASSTLLIGALVWAVWTFVLPKPDPWPTPSQLVLERQVLEECLMDNALTPEYPGHCPVQSRCVVNYLTARMPYTEYLTFADTCEPSSESWKRLLLEARQTCSVP